MGVYEKTGEFHNEKPVWSRHDGTQKLKFTSGKFQFTEMTGITNIDMTENGARKKWMWVGWTPGREVMRAVVSNTSLLPDQISEWDYIDGDKWSRDPLLNVTGNIITLRSVY